MKLNMYNFKVFLLTIVELILPVLRFMHCLQCMGDQIMPQLMFDLSARVELTTEYPNFTLKFLEHVPMW